MNKEKLKEEVEKIRWFHRIDLGNGVITPGRYDPSVNLIRLGIPENLQGNTVLDIGAWDGFYSFLAERRGALHVLSTDSFCWSGGGWGTKAGFDLARKALNSKVEDQEIDVLEISPDKVGVFDLVLFLGVLYHMRHPLQALERVFSVTESHLILETHVAMLFTKSPALRFYPGAELNQDITSWCGPNPAAVLAMLKTVGFRKAEIFSSQCPPLFHRVKKVIRHKINKHPLKSQQSFLHAIQQGRMVFHAWR